MQIISACPHCGRKYRINADMAGRQTRCPACQQPFEIQVDREGNAAEAPAGDPPEYVDPLALPVPSQLTPAGQHPFPEISNPSSDALGPHSVPGPPSASWRHQIKRRDSETPFGSTHRAVMFLGVFFILVGLLLSLLPLLGTQVARFQGAGNLGQVMGLVMGLIGSGLLALSLRNFKTASLAGGLGTALFVFVVFLISVLSNKPRAAPVAHPDLPANPAPDSQRVVSPWIESFPRWEGFDDSLPGPSVADRWTRIQFDNGKLTASFPSKPAARPSPRIESINRQSIGQAVTYEAESKGHEFSLTYFQYLKERQNETQILNAIEASLQGNSPSTSLVVNGRTARDLIINRTPKSTHIRIMANGSRVVVLQVTGPSDSVPGPISRRFLKSCEFTGGGSNPSRRPGGQAIQAELSPQQLQKETEILTRARQLEGLMDEYLSMRARVKFPAHYLSEAAGNTEGSRKFYCHPDKLPIAGVELQMVTTTAGPALQTMVPVYDAADVHNTVSARAGYGIGAINVNADDYVRGVQFVFMRITPKGFDTDDAYTSGWFGTPSTSGNAIQIGGDGRPVYGFWLCKSRVVNSLGVIYERE